MLSRPERVSDRTDGGGIGGGAKAGEELGDGAAGAGITELGCDFGERDENEGAFSETRVGNIEAGFAEEEVVVEEDVEVEGTRAVGDGCGAVAAEIALDGEEGVEEIAWGEWSFEGQDRVEETGLIGEADGGGGMERGACGDSAQGGETCGGGGECGLRRADGAGKVGTECDVGGRHGKRVAELAGLGGVETQLVRGECELTERVFGEDLVELDLHGANFLHEISPAGFDEILLLGG